MHIPSGFTQFLNNIFTLSWGLAYRVPIPLIYFSSIYWDKHFNLNTDYYFWPAKIPGCVCVVWEALIAWFSCETSYSFELLFGLLNTVLESRCGGLMRLQGLIRGFVYSFPAPSRPPTHGLSVLVVSLRGLLLTGLRWFYQVLCRES
jgi:hypothetical protein